MLAGPHPLAEIVNHQLLLLEQHLLAGKLIQLPLESIRLDAFDLLEGIDVPQTVDQLIHEVDDDQQDHNVAHELDFVGRLRFEEGAQTAHSQYCDKYENHIY